MTDCLYAIWTIFGRSVTSKLAMLSIATAFALSAGSAHAQPMPDPWPGNHFTPQPAEDVAADDECEQAWPVECSGSGGDLGCGGWNVVKDLAQSEVLPGDNYASCSTGIRLAKANGNAQGEAVGTMFPGTVVFSQSGRSRDGRDYGGVVVIQLQLDDGSPQCFARYMFLDRRDLVKTGEEVLAGQRIGSIASRDMNATKDWWQREWNGMRPQVKIDIGCDEALVNMPHFMPKEPFTGEGPSDPNSCPLTKTRFPSRPLEYLATYESAKNSNCSVGVRKDARGGLVPAIEQDNTERDDRMGGQYVDKVKPRGFIKHKKTPVFSVFENAATRQNLWGANKNRSSGSILFRDHTNYLQATALRCSNMREIFRGKNDESLSPAEVRERLAHCTNQYILGRSMFFQVYEPSATGVDILTEPLPEHLREFFEEEEREEYEEWLAQEDGNFSDVKDLVNKVLWRDLCQPLATQPVISEDYKVREILTKSWQELLFDWPQDNDLQPVNRDPISRVDINDYTDFPFERINDPAHPFSPRHIFAETERERYSDYGVQCAATPVDIILGRYEGAEDDQFPVYGQRDKKFHMCITCRIEINETKEACIADPYSFTNLGGCDGGMGPTTASGELCTNLDPAFKTLLDALEAQYGLTPNLLHAVATAESGCSADARSPVGAQGMFQFMPATAAGMRPPVNPWDPESAAEGSARYNSQNAATFDCDLPLTLASYNCGPGCAADYKAGRRSSLPEETQGYIAKITAMLGGTTNACSADGPFPNGDGVGPGGGGGGGSDSGSTGGFGGGGDVFGSGQGGEGSQSTAGYGNFDPNGCPAGYSGNANSFSVGPGGKKCPSLSYPTPDLPGVGGYGCLGRFFYPPGCSASCVAHFNQGCVELRGYNGPMRGNICAPGCPGRIHEGMDIAFEFGAPIYASADGRVSRVSDNGYVTIDHSGACIDTACSKRFGQNVNTRYYHMGLARVLVNEGDEVSRCQQIGTVGDELTEGVPHLHYEAWDPGNGMISGSFGYYALNQDSRYHSHVDDKSCSGGVWDAEGRIGASQGICNISLPVDTQGKEDLEPPAYYEEFDMTPVQMPDPESENRGQNYEYDVPGMVFNGAWTRCTSNKLNGAAKELCESLNTDEPGDADEEGAPPPTPTGGSSAFINPLPCRAYGSPFGTRSDPFSGAPKMHTGQDIPAPAGTPVFASADGTVEVAGSGGGYGNFVVVRHADGSVTRYAHNSQICPQTIVGQTVVQGQVLSLVGTTGNSTGNHLHFEVMSGGGDFDDPVTYIPAPTPGAAQCGEIESYTCGQTIEGLPVGAGVAGIGKTLCIDKPCSVRYDEADTVAQCGWPTDNGGCGTLGNFSQRNDGKNGDCCYNITAPVPALNILKVRPGYDNEALKPGALKSNPRATGRDGEKVSIVGGWDGQRVQDGNGAGLKGEGGNVAVSVDNPGAPEGYTFHEHFRDHRPYMRWWDTGAESGNMLQEHTDAESKGGSFDALVGVGIEKSNCGIGGWGNPDKLDGNTSWVELKMYQARSQYMTGLRCISRYEKLFKRGAAEDYVLRLAGGNFTSSITGTGTAGSLQLEWPLGWRGYTSEPEQAYRFPYFITLFRTPQYMNPAGAFVGGGLDNALPGDILIWDADVSANERLQHVAYVSKADNEAMNNAGGPEYILTKKRFFPPPVRAANIPSVTVMDYNHGKYPDACGTTNWWGVGPERTLYKGRIPPNMQAIADRKDVTRTTCANPDLSSCIENLWGSVKIYRPWKDVRD